MRKTLIILLTTVLTGEPMRERSVTTISTESSSEPLIEPTWEDRLHGYLTSINISDRLQNCKRWSMEMLLQAAPDLGTSIACYYAATGLGVKWDGPLPYKMRFDFSTLGILFPIHIGCYIALTFIVQFKYFYQSTCRYTLTLLFFISFARFWCFLIAKLIPRVEYLLQFPLIVLSQFCLIYSQTLVGLNIFDRSKKDLNIPRQNADSLGWLDRLWINIFYVENEETSIYKQSGFLSGVSLLHEIGGWVCSLTVAYLLGLEPLKVVPSIQIDTETLPTLWITVAGATGYLMVFCILYSLVSKDVRNSRLRTIQFRIICFAIDIAYILIAASVTAFKTVVTPPFNQILRTLNIIIIRSIVIKSLNDSLLVAIENRQSLQELVTNSMQAAVQSVSPTIIGAAESIAGQIVQNASKVNVLKKPELDTALGGLTGIAPKPPRETLEGVVENSIKIELRERHARQLEEEKRAEQENDGQSTGSGLA